MCCALPPDTVLISSPCVFVFSTISASMLYLMAPLLQTFYLLLSESCGNISQLNYPDRVCMRSGDSEHITISHEKIVLHTFSINQVFSLWISKF